LEKLRKELKQADERLDNVMGEFACLCQNVEKEFKEHDAEVEGAAPRISGLESVVKHDEQRISVLEDEVRHGEQRIGVLESKVMVGEQRNMELEGLLEVAYGDVEGLKVLLEFEESRASELEGQLEEVKGELDESRFRFGEIDLRRVELDKLYAEVGMRCEGLENELGEVRGELDDARREKDDRVSELEGLVECVGGELRDAKAREDELRYSVLEFEGLLEGVRNELQVAKTSEDGARAALDRVTQLEVLLEESRVDMQETEKTAKQKSVDRDLEMEINETSLEESNDRCLALEVDLESAQAELDRQREESEYKGRESVNEKATSNNLSEKLISLAGDHSALRQQLGWAEEEISRINERCGVVEVERDAAVGRGVEIEAERKSLQAMFAQVKEGGETDRFMHQHAIDGKDEEFRSMENEKRLQIQQLQNNLIEVQQEHDEMVGMIKGLEMELSKQRAQSEDDLSVERSLLEGRIEQAEGIVEGVRVELRDAEIEREGLERQITETGVANQDILNQVNRQWSTQVKGLESGIFIDLIVKNWLLARRVNRITRGL
jgi:chromosome segregation ATPase